VRKGRDFPDAAAGRILSGRSYREARMKFNPPELSEEELRREEQEEAFYEAAHRIFGHNGIGIGIGMGADIFGGNLYYVYVYDKDLKNAPVDYTVRLQFAGHDAIVDKLLPQIKARRINSVSEKLGQAMDDVDVEDLAPLYEATGKKWGKKTKYFRNGTREIERLEKAELIHGAIKRTPLKQLQRGRRIGYRKIIDPKETRELKSRVQGAARSLRKALGRDARIPKTKVANALKYDSAQKFSYELKRHRLDFDEVIKGI
jgi:hypothetical protein